MVGVQQMFRQFAATHADLPLYAAICRAVAHDDETATLLLAAGPGQRRPVLWLAALHDLVLGNPTVAAARWYPSVTGRGRSPSGDPWPAVRQTVLDQRTALTEVIATRTTQTNEVNRAVYLAAALTAACDDLPGQTVTLVEMGASAGLLLLLDRYRIERRSAQGSAVVGDPDSPVVCVGEDRSHPVPAAGLLPPIAGRVGIDLHPVPIDDQAALRWLEACLWPDVPGRVERFRAAVGLARQHPPALMRGDMIDDLTEVITVAQGHAEPGTHVVVFSSWALTYVARERREEIEQTLRQLSAAGVPFSWVTAEPVGCVPGIPLPPPLAADSSDGTVLAVRRWRHGVETEPRVLGICHPHGAWVDLSTP